MREEHFMKKNPILLFLLGFSILLCACAHEAGPLPTTNPTVPETSEQLSAKPPASSVTTPPPETTVPEATTTPPSDPFAEYYDILNTSVLEDTYTLRWATGFVYDDPREINLFWLFYNGFLEDGSWESYTPEETAFLKSCQELGPYDAQKRPAEKINTVLQTFFGISLSNVTSGIPERWVYYEGTDSYYTTHGDCSFPEPFTITNVESDADGTLRIYYTLNNSYSIVITSDGEFIEAKSLVLTLRPTENGTYQAVSNQIISTE